MNDLHFGVCVGIDRYPGFPGRDLGSAARDAASFRDWLVADDGGQVPEANVRLVSIDAGIPFADLGDARPQMDEVVLALDEVNGRLREHVRANPQDWSRTRLYIYAAGHGVAVPNGEGALLMANSKPKVYFNVDLSLYADWYLRCGFVHEVVVLVDCCREIVDGMPQGFVLFESCEHPQVGGGDTVRYVAYASRYGDAAFEPMEAGPDLARGYFTKALIDGLNGAAEDERTREVTAASLSQYVQQAVERATRGTAPYPQRAEMNGDMGVRLVLRPARGAPAAGPAPTTHVATIRFPGGFAGPVALVTGDGREWGRWNAAAGPWTTEPLPDTFYRVVPLDGAVVVFQQQGLFALVGADADVQL